MGKRKASSPHAKPLIDFTEIPPDASTWEMCVRDVLAELGFVIEEGPDRGPDKGRDLIALETYKGPLGSETIRWLVSCKHNAHAGAAVTEADEPNILERVRSFGADGFLGVYSTIASSNLSSRLVELRRQRHLRFARLLDGRAIEAILLRLGFSAVLLRYFPLSYVRIRPVHALWAEYRPMTCAVCGKDILADRDLYGGLSLVQWMIGEDDEVKAVIWSCKDDCGQQIERRHAPLISTWRDIGDLATPALFLQHVIALANNLRAGTQKFSDKAFEQQKDLVLLLGQKVLREMTERERKVLAEKLELLELGL